MWKAMLDESQAGIKIAGRNIKNLRYAEDTTLMGEREEEHHWLNGHELEQLWEILKYSVAWYAAVHGVTKSWTQLSNWTTTTKCLKPVDTTSVGEHYSIMSQKDLAYLSWIYFTKNKSNESLTSETGHFRPMTENVTSGQFQDTWSNKYNSACGGDRTEYPDLPQSLIHET